jgi:GNAT superfamily N-acetyltransferase
MYVRVWALTPGPERGDAFRAAYGPDGDRAQLFRGTSGFLETVLLPPSGLTTEFLALDAWHDASSWTAFLDSRARDYADLERACARLTAAERDVGVLRRARPDDAAAIASLSGEMGYPATAAQVLPRLETVSGRPDELVLVAEPAPRGRVGGWVHVFGAVRLESPPYAEIGGLVVAAAARSGRIGEALLAAVHVWADRCGYADVRVRSNAVRERAHAFYLRCGYTLMKSQRVFVKPLPSRP